MGTTALACEMAASISALTAAISLLLGGSLLKWRSDILTQPMFTLIALVTS